MKADTARRRITCVILLALSAVLLLLLILIRVQTPDPDAYIAQAPSVEVSLHPGMAQNWLPNSGDAAALDELPGIGAVLAQRIIENREQDGLFFFPEDLMAVSGIGESRLQGIMEWLSEHPEAAYTLPAAP